MTIPNSVTIFGYRSCEKATSLTTLTIPNSVTEIGGSAFFGCISLTSITIPDSVTEIGEDAFSSCESLVSITIPDSVTEIGEMVFYSCHSLTSVTIPASVTEIGENAFRDCTTLTSVYYNCEDPLESSSFGIFEQSLSNATLYVPAVAVEKCKVISPWKDFKNIVAHEFSGVECVSGDRAKIVTGYYDITGVPVDEDYEGLVIVRFSDGSCKKILNR